MSKKTERLKDLVNEVLKKEEENLYWLDWGKNGKRWRLLIYLDSPEGVGMDSCVRISNKLSKKLDSVELIDRKYDLEISSPGIERPLITADHYKGAIEENINVKTYGPVKNQRQFEGILEDYIKREDGDYIKLRQREESIEIPMKKISNASVKAEI